MPRIAYIEKRFSKSSMEIINNANEIITEYLTDGYDLTLRQLYYQFVSRDLIANKQSEYKRLSSVINNARLAGLIDWNSIVDRTRSLKRLANWEGPADIIEACASQFRIDKWATQEYRPEVWIEKDALVGIIQNVCDELQVPYTSCRGFTSQSEAWRAGQRMINSQGIPIIFHLADHDPSGLDMTRDIKTRISLFIDEKVKLKRLALNMKQIEKYNPPPNPTKTTDPRAVGYITSISDNSWELDALEPRIITDLIRKAVLAIRDEDLWQEAIQIENKHKRKLQRVAKGLK